MAVLDAIVSTLAIVLAFWLTPDKVTQIMVFVAIWQTIVIAVIAGITAEDVALKNYGTYYDSATKSYKVLPDAYQDRIKREQKELDGSSSTGNG
jgi:hypothetical protein